MSHVVFKFGDWNFPPLKRQECFDSYLCMCLVCVNGRVDFAPNLEFDNKINAESEIAYF